MKGYHDLYLNCVLLLAEVLETFRNSRIENYGLFPSHYLSASALDWDAMLNMTKVKVELIPDRDMCIFFEKCMRGGVSYVFNKYSKANNKYLKSCDPKQESKHIIYLYANHLYGYAMSKFPPASGFKWIDPKDFELNKYSRNSSKGCVLEVDLEYAKDLPELHNDYLLAPDKIEMLSDYQLKIDDLYNISTVNVKELVPNLLIVYQNSVNPHS